MNQAQQIQVNNQQNHSECQSIESNLLDYQSSEITFPELPQQYNTVYDIYQKSRKKLHNLRATVQQLQMQILEMQRAKSDNKTIDDDGVIILQEDFDSENQFIENYQKQSNKRLQELKKLDDIYCKLKRIYIQQSILNNQKLKKYIISHIEQHRLVKQYKIADHYIIMLNKEIKYHSVAPQKIISHHHLNMYNQNDILNKSIKSNYSHTNRKQHKVQEEKVKGVSYGIKIINTQKLFSKFNSQKVLENQLNQGQLMKIKEEAQSQVNAAINIEVKSKNQFISIEYNIKRNQFYVLDDRNTISLVKLDGETLNLNLRLDKVEKVLMMKQINGNLWIGSTKGILREYLIQENNLRIKRLYGCFNSQKDQINNYLILNHNGQAKIIFNIRQKLLQINTLTYQIQQIYKFTNSNLYLVDNYIITQNQIYNSSVKGNKVSIDKVEILSSWYEKLSERGQQKIVYIKKLQNDIIGGIEKKQIQKDKYYIIMGDRFGNFSQIYS